MLGARHAEPGQHKELAQHAGAGQQRGGGPVQLGARAVLKEIHLGVGVGVVQLEGLVFVVVLARAAQPGHVGVDGCGFRAVLGHHGDFIGGFRGQAQDGAGVVDRVKIVEAAVDGLVVHLIHGCVAAPGHLGLGGADGGCLHGCRRLGCGSLGGQGAGVRQQDGEDSKEQERRSDSFHGNPPRFNGPPLGRQVGGWYPGRRGFSNPGFFIRND